MPISPLSVGEEKLNDSESLSRPGAEQVKDGHLRMRQNGRFELILD